MFLNIFLRFHGFAAFSGTFSPPLAHKCTFYFFLSYKHNQLLSLLSLPVV